MIHLEKYFEVLGQTSQRNAREYNVSLIFMFKYMTLSRQYTALCGGVTERTVTDVSVVIYIIALCRSRTPSTKTVHTFVCAPAR